MPGPGSREPRKATISGVYDYLLGGRNHFDADVSAAENLLDKNTGYPGIRRMVRDNRRYVTGVVRCLAANGDARQFLDLGSGPTTSPSVHEAALAA